MGKLITKKDIQEVIDDNNNLIGTDDLPSTGSNKETEAGHTTDYNARVHGQNYKNDFLGRFGFYFYESEDKNNEYPQVVKDIRAIVGPEKAHKVMQVIKPHLEKTIDEMSGNFVSESKVEEDKLLKDKNDNTFVKKEKKEIKDKVEHVADLLSKLPKNDLDKLMNLLEKRKA